MEFLKLLLSRVDSIYSTRETQKALTMSSYRLPSVREQSLANSHETPLAQKLSNDPITSRTAQSTAISVHQTAIGGYWRNVTIIWSKNLTSHSLGVVIDSVETGNEQCSCKIDLKPWQFWSKKGYKMFEVDGNQIEVYWDLRSAKFSGSPEPMSNFYVALVCDDEMVLLLGDYEKKAYKRTRSRNPLVEPMSFYKKEHVFSKKSFSSRARFDGRKEDHEIVVEISSSGHKDPEMWISIDGIILMHLKNLQWKFRGNETLVVNNFPIQVFWDVYAWLFSNPGTGYGLFIFKPGSSEIDNGDHEESSRGEDSDCSSGDSNYFSTHSSSKVSQFCLFLYAWKVE